MGVWYRAGTVAVTSGSKTVTGTGTQWQNLIFGVAPGVTFYGPDGKPYEIDTVNSNTSLTLATNYSGTTASGQAYAIDPTRSGSVASLAAQTSEVLKFSQGQFTQIQNWFTGAASANVTLTSPAGQQITVPSYSKVTSEGEGQAARAKTEADKAAASAALAGDIVAASALPLPDVWAPLSDSLRMITGYGRDVLVGSDVVARMVNFSRNSTATYIGKDGQLKTAAANEPRFEKEGLLIEGQSTNYITTSEGLNQLGAEAGATVVTENGLKLVQYAGAGQLSKDYTTPANAQLTFSFFVKLGESNTKIALQLRDGVGVGRTAYFDIKPTGELGVTDTQGVLVASSWKMNSVSKTVFRVSGTISSSDSTVYRIYRYAPVAGETFGSFQLEPLPFASSYIPTAGAAVTRVQDLAWLPAYGNEPLGLVMSIAAEADLLGKGLSSWPRPFELNDSENKGGHIVMVYGSWDGADLVGKKTTVALRFSDRSHWAAGAKRPSQWNGYINQIYTGNIYLFGTTNPARAFYGHVRNIRAWFVQLSDDQHKAIK